jgi:hypothetical protein
MPRFPPTAVAAALCAVACKASAPSGAIVVGSAAVSEANLAGNPELAESAEQVRSELKAALESTGHFAFRPGAEGRIRLEVEQARRVLAPQPTLTPGQLAPEREMAHVAVALEMTTPGAQGDLDRLVAEGEARRPTGADDGLEPAARIAAFDAALDAAMREAVVALGYQVEARKKTDAALVADLSAPDARLRDYAIRVLADRRSPAAVPQLILRLQDENDDVARRAVGALVAIGDRRAVRPLIEMTKKRHPEQVRPIVYALGSLGGSEAEAFLFTLESGSPDEEIRRAARDGLADLRGRKDDAQKAEALRRRLP